MLHKDVLQTPARGTPRFRGRQADKLEGNVAIKRHGEILPGWAIFKILRFFAATSILSIELTIITSSAFTTAFSANPTHPQKAHRQLDKLVALIHELFDFRPSEPTGTN
jgi:hypothetical protein